MQFRFKLLCGKFYDSMFLLRNSKLVILDNFVVGLVVRPFLLLDNFVVGLIVRKNIVRIADLVFQNL